MRPTATSWSPNAPSFGIVGKRLQLKIRVEDLPQSAADKAGQDANAAHVTLA